MPALSNRNCERRIRDAARQLQPLTPCARELMRLAEDQSATIDQALAVIQSDAVLATQLLKTANSSFFGLSRRISTIRDAAVMLGLHGVRNVAVAASLLCAADRCRIPNCLLQPRRLNQHLLGVAMAARSLAMSHQPDLADSAFLAGLLHDLGRLLMLKAFPSDYSDLLDACRDDTVPLHYREKALFGFDHATVIDWVAADWRLPAVLTQTICSHHISTAADHDEMSMLLQAGNALAKIARVGDSGNPHIDATALIRVINKGCAIERVSALAAGLPMFVHDVAAQWLIAEPVPELRPSAHEILNNLEAALGTQVAVYSA